MILELSTPSSEMSIIHFALIPKYQTRSLLKFIKFFYVYIGPINIIYF